MQIMATPFQRCLLSKWIIRHSEVHSESTSKIENYSHLLPINLHMN